MARTVVALYEDASTADQVVSKLTSNRFDQKQIKVLAEPGNGLSTTLTGMGIPDEHASHYRAGINRGGALVTVRADDSRVDEAIEIMNRYTPIDVEKRVAEGHSADLGVADLDTSTSRSVGTAARSDVRNQLDEDEVLEVAEEELHVGKREVDRGRVRLEKTVEETPVEEQVTLRDERITVERTPVNRKARAGELDNAFREESFEMREIAEEAVVAKETRVVEEVHLRKDVQDRTETIRDTVRRTDVRVIEDQDTTFDRDHYSGYDSDFRALFDNHYSGQGYTYEQYEPAYRYGYTLANDANYSNREWQDVERDARTRWEQDNQGTWENFKDAVRDAWDSVRGRR